MDDVPPPWIPIAWIFLGLGILVFLGVLFPVQWGHGGSDRRSLAMADVKQANAAVKHYLVEYGRIPAGGNGKLMMTLRGQNPRRIVFIEAPAKSLNAHGEFIDPWGMPYRFDTSDPEKPRVWSCGKDRRDDGGAEGSDDITSWR